VPASRPRVTRYGAYYSKTYAEYLARCSAAALAWHVTLPSGACSALVEAVVQRPAKTVLSAPRGDVDNYAKGPLDGLNKAGEWDDTLVVSLTVTKRWAEPGEDPHTLLHITPM
jgi:Holliday junction resolvase RusA-like endonuclease